MVLVHNSRWRTPVGISALSEQREKVRLAVRRGQAAVNREDHAVDKAGVIAGQERDHGRHLVRRGRPAHRQAPAESRHDGLTLQQLRRRVRGGQAGGNGVHPDAAGGVLQGKRSRQVRKRTFGRVVPAPASVAAEAGGGRHVDDRALVFRRCGSASRVGPEKAARLLTTAAT